MAAALAEVPEEALVVLVHDAARPLVDDAVVERLLAPLGEGFDGVVPVLPVADTLKRVRDGVVEETVDRIGARGGADATGLHRAGAPAGVRGRPRGSNRLRLARRAYGGSYRGRRRRTTAAQDHDLRRSRARRVVALRGVVFDVGETLVDEERWWRRLCERAGLQPHVVWAALGVTIERGEEHDALWGHLGLESPTGWWQEIPYSLDDLYPDAWECLERVGELGFRVGIVGNQTETLEAWARESALPADVISSSASLGVRKPDPAFFHKVAELMGQRSAGARVRGRPRGQRRSSCRCRRTGRRPRPTRAVGAPAADAARSGARPRRPRVAPRRASLARLMELRVGIGFDAHALEAGVPLVLGGVPIEYPRGLAGHSDGDVLTHALIDAVLGAANLGDIGSHFPSGDERFRGASSLDLLRDAYAEVRGAGWALVNADCVLIGEEPRIGGTRDEMGRRLAGALGVDPDLVAVRATTTDGLGFTGRGEGLAAQAVALLGR